VNEVTCSRFWTEDATGLAPPGGQKPPLVARLFRTAPRCVSLQHMHIKRSLPRGFTTIELLIVLAIGALLAVIAVPSMRDMLNNMRQSSASALMLGDLNLARGEAIKRNARMLVCGRNAAGTDCAGVTNWAVGWVVCIEAAVPDTCAAATLTEPNPITVRPPVDINLTVTTSAGALRFNPNSTQGAGGVASVAVNGTWSGANARTLLVAATGNISR